MDPQQLNDLFDLAVEALAIISPIAGAWAYTLKNAKDELIEVLDKAPIQNQSLKNLAHNLGLKKAGREMSHLLED